MPISLKMNTFAINGSCLFIIDSLLLCINQQEGREFMNRNAIDILTWGAPGDGVVSDTKIIQQAIDEAAQQKQSVIFPAGVYLVGS